MRDRDWLLETLSIGNVHNSLSGRSCDGRRSMWGFQVQAAANVPPESMSHLLLHVRGFDCHSDLAPSVGTNLH